MKLGLITDVHLAPLPHAPARWHNDYDFAGTRDRLANALRTLAGEGVDGVALLGDLTNGGDADSLDAVLATVTEAGLPALAVPGNHDCERELDALPRAVQRAGAHVALPGAKAQPWAGVPVAGIGLAHPPAGRGFAPAALPQLDGAPMLLVSHFPVVSRRERVLQAGYKYAGDLVGLAGLTAHLDAAQAPVVVVSGHLHVRDAVGSGRVLQLLVPAMIEPPYECAVVAMGGDPLTVDYRAIAMAPTAGGLDVPLLAPAESRWVFGAAGWSAAEVPAATG
ncbi:MAG: metallophosphoesterase family protein [Gaiellales bacterium]